MFRNVMPACRLWTIAAVQSTNSWNLLDNAKKKTATVVGRRENRCANRKGSIIVFTLLAWALGFAAVVGTLYYLVGRLEGARRALKRAWLQLERLGERIVSSTTHIWTNADDNGLASDANNWNNGPIMAGDTLQLGSTNGSNANATFDNTFTALGANISVFPTYNGTVNFTDNLAFTGSLSDTSAAATVKIALGTVLSVNQCYLFGGTINGPGSLQITDLANNPGLMNIGSSATLNALTVSGGTSTQFNVQGDVSIEGGGTVTLYGPTAWTNGVISLAANNSITNFGSWQVSCDSKIIGGSFFNAGTFTKNAGNGTTQLGTAFSNAPVNGSSFNPTVTANSGTIEFKMDADQVGLFFVNAPGTLLFDAGTQTFTGASQFYGTGNVTLNGTGNFLTPGNVTVAIAGPAFELGGTARLMGTAAPPQATGTYVFSGPFTWDGGTMMLASVGANGTLHITGNPAVLRLTSSYLTTWGTTTYDATQDIRMSGATINNYGHFILNNAQKITDTNPAGPASAFLNQDDGQGHRGELTKLNSTASTFDLVFENWGTIDFGAATGQLIFTGDFTQAASGTLAINIGSATAFDTLQVTGQANLDGHLQINLVNGYTHGQAAFDLIHAAGGVSGTFADVTAPWTPAYYPDDVFVV
jgi:hypothetical protein